MNVPNAKPIAIVHRSADDPRRTEALGPYCIESLIDESEEGAGTVWRIRLAPGQRTQTSFHRVAEEYYYVLRGCGTAILDGVERRLSQGDFLRLPPGTRHAFLTADEPLEMLNVHTPGCRPNRDTYFE